MFRTHVFCVTDKGVQSLTEYKCFYSAIIKRKRKKDDKKYYVEKEGRNLEHIGGCLRNSAIFPGSTTARSKFMRHVQALQPIPLAATATNESLAIMLT